MATNATEISQPGWTGTPSAADRASCAADTLVRRSVGHRSMTASLRTSSLFWSSIVRTSSPVSVGLCTIETGVTELAQCQAPWDFASTRPRCKSPQNRLYGSDIVTTMASPASDLRWLQQRSSRDVTWSAARPQRSSLSCRHNETAARSGDIDRARPALHPV